MTKLSVNIDKIALLRNSRNNGIPNLLEFVKSILDNGANGITIHPRPDKRHILHDDVKELVREVKTAEINIEGDIGEEFIDLVLNYRPAQCTLVPISYGELTSHRGWDTKKWGFLLRPIVSHLKAEGIRVSLFVDPQPEMVKNAADIGADRVELYTGPYASLFESEPSAAVGSYKECANLAQSLGLGVNAGHDLNEKNLAYFLNTIQSVAEVSIGHHLISDALRFGIGATVKRYVDLISNQR